MEYLTFLIWTIESQGLNLYFSNSANEKIFKENSKIYIDALRNSCFKEEFTYLEENIPNDINKKKIRSMIIKIEKEKLYVLTRLFVD